MASQSVSPRQRVNARNRCPICGHDSWCFFTGDGQGVVCARTIEGSAAKAGSAGWLHRLVGRSAAPPTRIERSGEVSLTVDFDMLSQRLRRDTRKGFLGELARHLGVACMALEALGCSEYQPNVAAFPMYDAFPSMVGIRLRAADGHKWAVKGSRQGLFLAVTPARGSRVIICEGPTDAAAMIGLGYVAIGRPSCRGCVSWTAELVRGCDATIIADRDAAGKDGALELASGIRRLARSVRLAEPTIGKDTRDWVRQVGEDEVAATLDNAERA